MKDKSEDKPDQMIAAGGVASPRPSVFGIADVWMTYSFAREWFEDAVHEAKTGTDHNARRREIVFAVCFSESYLFEWIRDDIFDRKEFEKLVANLNQVFPPGQVQPVLEKWKKVPKKLLNAGLIPAAPNLVQPYWEEFRKLVEWRHGLVHARSSRPGTAKLPKEEQPRPSKGDLDNLPAGWATEVVVTLVMELHRVVGTAPPGWLKMP